jgi:hypothetical protein
LRDLAPDGKENEDTHKFMSITLLQCYKYIDDTSIEEFSDVNTINAMTKKNRNFLQIERWAELFKGDKAELEKEIDLLNDALVDFVPEEEKRSILEEKNNFDQREDYIIQPPKNYQLAIFGYNLSDPYTKYTLGFFFLLCLFNLLYFLLYKMLKPTLPSKAAKISKKNK